MRRPSLTQLAHDRLARLLAPGDYAVDATVGNGHDTRFLAEQVGAQGHVLGLDIQESALHVTRARLQQAGLDDRVSLLQQGHEALDEQLPEAMRHRLKVVMFNLGYLPGGDHELITRPDTTLQALEAALAHLREDGLISLMIYRGHAGGEEECRAILDWLDSAGHRHEHPDPQPRPATAPLLLHVRRGD